MSSFRRSERSMYRRQAFSRGGDNRRRQDDRDRRDKKMQNIVSPWETPNIGYAQPHMMQTPMIMYQPVFVPVQHGLQMQQPNLSMHVDRSRDIKSRLSKPSPGSRRPSYQSGRQRGGPIRRGTSSVRVDVTKLKPSTREKLEIHQVDPENIKCFICKIPHFESLQDYIDHLKCAEHREIRKQYDIYSVKSNDSKNLAAAIQRLRIRLSTKGSLAPDLKPRNFEFPQSDFKCCGSTFKNRVLLNAHRLHTEHLKVADIESVPTDGCKIDTDPEKNEESKKILLEAIEKAQSLPEDSVADENFDPEKPTGLHQIGVSAALNCVLCSVKPDEQGSGGNKPHYFKSMPRRHLTLVTHYDNVMGKILDIEEKAKTVGDDIWKQFSRREREHYTDTWRRRRSRSRSGSEKPRRRPSKYDYDSHKSDDEEEAPKSKKRKFKKDNKDMESDTEKLEEEQKENSDEEEAGKDRNAKKGERVPKKQDQKDVSLAEDKGEHEEQQGVDNPENTDNKETAREEEEEELNYEEDHGADEEEEETGVVEKDTGENEDDEDEDMEGELREIEEQFCDDDDE